MNGSDIILAVGKFEAKIQALESTVTRLEASVDKLAVALGESKAGWKVILVLIAFSGAIGSTIHAPIEFLAGIFK